jgi:hypothetical protein
LIATAVRGRLFAGEICCDVAGRRRSPYRRAGHAHTINCIWWNIINGTIINPAVAAGSSTLAKGNPLASDFFEPQKTIAIWSSVVNRSRRATVMVETITIPRSAALVMNNATKRGDGESVPDPGYHTFAESRVHHQQNRSAVDITQHLLLSGHESADPSL